jgi:hypothetical protein
MAFEMPPSPSLQPDRCHARARWCFGILSHGPNQMGRSPEQGHYYCVVLRMPGEMPFGKQTLDLMARYVWSLHPGGAYALTINRQSGAHEIWCGFPSPRDAETFAKAINAQSQLSEGWATRHVVIADDACFDRIQAATPPARKRAKPAEPDRLASRVTARSRRQNYEGLE